MPNTANLALPLLAAGQAQKHVTLNESLISLDNLMHIAVTGPAQDEPPAEPASGARWLIGDSPTGAWAGRAGQLAARLDEGWRFHSPREGWLVHDTSSGRLLVRQGAAWVETGAPAELQGVSRIGLGTTADASNPFSAELNSALLTAKPTGEGGTGDLRLTLSKEAAGDTASLIYQTDFSARAEVGLTGDNNFHIKVSSDGAIWRDAITVDRQTGGTSMRSIDSLQVVVAHGGVVAVTTPSAGGIVFVSLVDALYPQNGVSSIFAYDNGGSPILTTMVLGGSAENLGTTTLTGTSGTDGKVALAVKDDGKLYIQNRFSPAASRQICLTFINSYRAI